MGIRRRSLAILSLLLLALPLPTLSSGCVADASPTVAPTATPAPTATTAPTATPAPTVSPTPAPVVSPVPGQATPVTLPSDRVRTLARMGLTETSYRRMAVQSASYEGNAGWEVSSLCVSPDYTLRVNGTDVPVYASPVYVYDGNTGALQNFAMVDVPEGAFYLDVAIKPRNLSFQSAIALPESLGVTPSVAADRTITARVTGHGIYSFLLTGADGAASQQHALVLLVRKLQDEEAEIARYEAEYGADHVIVYEPGTHYVDHIEIADDNTVVYLRRGSLLVAKHANDIDSDEDNRNKAEPGASASNGWGLNRYPFLVANNRTNVRIVGRGTMDLGQLDWHERRGLLFTSCATVVVDGVNLVNFPEWNVTAYRCFDVTVRNTMVLGWKTNSDAFDICNTVGAVVENCYARSGDDLFQVKTMGGPVGSVLEDVLFTRCIAWGSKARAFGVTAGVQRDIRKVVFRDSAVLFRDATWDNERLGSLSVIVEEGDGDITDVRFENIEIHYDFGRAINATILRTDSAPNQITGLVFENITYRSGLPSQIRTRTPGDNRIEAVFRNVRANGVLLTEDNASSAVQVLGPGSRLTFE